MPTKYMQFNLITYELNMYIFTCRVCSNPNLLKYKMKEVTEDNPLTTFQQYYTYKHALYLVEFELTQKLSFLMDIFPVTNLVQFPFKIISIQDCSL